MIPRRPYVLLCLAIAVGSVLLMAILVVLVATTHFRSVQIAAGRTVNGDLVTTSARVDIRGTVRGDVRARSLFLRQVGEIDGDMSVVAGRAELRGPVSGSVHAYGGSISLYGHVAGDVEIYAGHLTIVEGAVIEGDLIVHGGSATLIARSRIRGDLLGEALRVTVEGRIDGNVDLSVWRLSFAPEASVGGTIQYESSRSASIPDSASVRFKEVSRIDPADRIPLGSVFLWHTAAIPRYLMMLTIGLILVMLAPNRLARIAEAPRQAWLSTFLSGVAVVTFGPIALATAALFVVTLPIVAAGGVLLFALMYLSLPMVGLAVGRIVLRRPEREQGRAAELRALGTGITLLAIARLVPIPNLDIGIATVTAIVGLGAFVVSFNQAGRGRTLSGTRPGASFAIGAVAGSLVVVLGLLAIAAAVSGALMSLAGLGGRAQFAWEVSPRRLAAMALSLAAASLAVGALMLLIRRKERTPIT